MINKFIDREQELDALSSIYNAPGACLAIVYGRRRIGKTELINHFISGKKAAYYMADKSSNDTQLKHVATIIGIAIKNQNLIRFGATGWEMLFDALKTYNEKEKLIIVIDEFPYLASTNLALASIFQSGWDQYLSKANVMLVLSGSSISMMHKEVLNYSAPLYGRSALVMNLRQMQFRSIVSMMPEDMLFEDKLYAYFIFGGVPMYYKLAHGNSIESIVKDILNKRDIFVNETSLLLSEEVNKDLKYMEILSVLAHGVNKPSEIASRIGIFQSNLDRYLSVLEKIGFVKKEYPVTVNSFRMAKGGIYRIEDPYVYFWAVCLSRYKELIETGSPSAESIVVSSIKTSIAQKRFEDFSKEFLIYLSNKARILEIMKIGRWWGADPGRPAGQNQEEIDVVALNEGTKEILFAECKWTSTAIGVDVYTDLKRKSKLVKWNNGIRKENFAIFSKAGFSNELIMLAKTENVMLFSLKEIEKALK